ncbi:MAG: hypothetical protein JWL63_2815 [Rhodocyclales bacterium]|nr:hypothetical protein [Rhodocyclales bacterium]
MKRLAWLPLLLSLFLTGCENSGASFLIDNDKNHSISLLREQRWFWSGEVEQKLVAARFPSCQRRVEVDPDTTAFTEMKLYQHDDRVFVTQQGSWWWAVSTDSCVVQKFATPPKDPGELVGTFKRKDGNVVFVPVAGS